VFAYTADAGEYRQRAADVLAALAAGIIQASVWKTFPLAEVAKAHAAIESRQSSGAIVLRP
jgi:NADPH2:quinone reductase